MCEIRYMKEEKRKTIRNLVEESQQTPINSNSISILYFPLTIYMYDITHVVHNIILLSKKYNIDVITVNQCLLEYVFKLRYSAQILSQESYNFDNGITQIHMKIERNSYCVPCVCFFM